MGTQFWYCRRDVNACFYAIDIPTSVSPHLMQGAVPRFGYSFHGCPCTVTSDIRVFSKLLPCFQLWYAREPNDEYCFSDKA